MTTSTTSRASGRRFRDKFVVEERHLPRATRRRLFATAAALILLGAVFFTVLLVGVLTHTGFERFDRPVELWFNEQRSGGMTGVMAFLAVVFGPVGMPIIVLVVTVVWLVAAKHAWRPLVLAVGMATGVVLAQVLAPIVRHPRPPIGLMLVGPDHSFSFPSGHVLGVCDFFLITAFLLASRVQSRRFAIGAFVVAIAMILIQMSSRLYLGYHWISDTTASLTLSMMILGVVIAVDTARTTLEPGEPVTGPHSQPQQDGT